LNFLALPFQPLDDRRKTVPRKFRKTDLAKMEMLPARSDTFRHFRRMHADRPFFVAQLGQSLDGRIATMTGDSRGLGSAPSLHHLHAIRAHVDGVMVGIGTVLADDPRLNVRLCEGKNPARIIIDSNGRLPALAKCLNGDDGARRIVFRGRGKAGESLPAGVEIVELDTDAKGHFDLKDLASRLLDLGFERILLEGGATLISRAIDAGLIDRLHLMVSPLIIGAGVIGMELEPIERISQARRPGIEITLLGEGEVLFDCDFGRQTEACHG
jgi:riboflavin-specific deaminase-like protein